MQGVLTPRNIKQIKNFQVQKRASQRISKDDVGNLLELAYQLNDFVWDIDVYPELDVVIGLKEMMDIFNELLTTQSDKFQISLGYDTTFKCGNFYISMILFQHILFEGSPCIPLAFLIHDRKLTITHEKLFKQLKNLIPNLSKVKTPLILDREKSHSNAAEIIPQLEILFCWNHIHNDTKNWVKDHGGTADDVKVYCDDVKNLLKADSEEQFNEILKTVQPRWSQPFVAYFDKNLEEDMLQHACRFRIEPYNLYNPISGVTNNPNEGANSKLKRILDHKEVPIDVMVLTCYYLQKQDIAEIKRGLIGTGEYKLRAEFSNCKQDPEDITLPSVYTVEELVDMVNNDTAIPLLDVPQRDNVTDNGQETASTNESANNTEFPSTNSGTEKENVEPNSQSETQENVNPNVKSEQESNMTSQMVLARDTVRNNKVVHVLAMKAFMVEGKNGTKYTVELFPKEKCICASSTTCYHIIAAKMSINLSVEQKRKPVNMTALRCNSKKRPFKKSGRKRPRPDDEDIIEAPDSDKAFQPSKKQNSDEDINNDIDTVNPEDNDQRSGQSIETNAQSNPSVNKAPWVKDLDLNQSDRDIIQNNEWLSCTHMSAVNTICQRQFEAVNGFQSTLLAAKLQKQGNKNMWVFPDNGFESRSAPSCNLHYNGYHHWVCTFQYVENGPVYLLDSLMDFKKHKPTVNRYLQLQIAQIYGSGQEEIIVLIPEIQQQTNSDDCGLFLIANMMEFCTDRYKGLQEGKLPFTFWQQDMRQTLIESLSSKHMKPFPKRKLKTAKTIRMHHDRVVLECCCRLPEIYDDMVECEMCGKWRFNKCEQLKTDEDVHNFKICSECKRQQSVQ